MKPLILLGGAEIRLTYYARKYHEVVISLLKFYNFLPNSIFGTKLSNGYYFRIVYSNELLMTNSRI